MNAGAVFMLGFILTGIYFIVDAWVTPPPPPPPQPPINVRIVQ